MKRYNAKRVLGTFELNTQEAFGELNLKGPATSLQLRYAHPITAIESLSSVYGSLHDLRKVSCLKCAFGGQGHAWKPEEKPYSFVNATPHYVVIGHKHFDLDQDSVRSISFAVDDICQIFDDFDAFGILYDPAVPIESLIPKETGGRSVPVGPKPQIAYFAGRTKIISVSLPGMKLEVNHWPHHQMGRASGISMRSAIMVTLAFDNAVTLLDCLDSVRSVARFLSMIAGRKQGVGKTSFSMSNDNAGDRPLELHLTFPPEGPQKALLSGERPDWFDMPLDPIRRQAEFIAVAKHWFSRNDSWKAARARYQGCLDKENLFDVDRLIAAANMFDILPESAVPISVDISPELTSAKEQCRMIMKSQAASIDRDSVLNSLGRMGKLSLPKKVLYRSDMVSRRLGHRFPQLSEVIKIAVQLRNHYVHGSSNDFNYLRVSPHSAFLTSCLEFVFVASDLIEAGWDAAEWNSRLHTSRHWFIRFRAEYETDMTNLMAAIRT